MSHSARPSFWWYLSIPIERVHSRIIGIAAVSGQ